MPLPIPASETRSPERVRAHYLIERELAARLREGTKAERRVLYRSVYDELFQRVPDHPQLAQQIDAAAREAEINESLALLRPFLRPETRYLEIGPGDCALAIAVAARVRQVYALDVSEEIASRAVLPGNVERIITDGCSVPVPAGSVDVAFSDQLMEHLHPDDAVEQLGEIYRALRRGGVYICLTPNRWSGPHDVSRYFDDVATGFHLREYSVIELTRLFREAGFRKLRVLVGSKSANLQVPAAVGTLVEQTLALMPRRFGRKMAGALP